MPITADHLTYVYGGNKKLKTTAVDDISVSIDDGQFIGLIGHTGSGKTTFLQLLAGLIKPESGTVLIDGEDIFAKNFDLHSIRGKVGIVFQYPEHQLFEETVFKDVCYGPKNLGLEKEEIESRANEALRLVGIDEAIFSQSPFELSGGQKRRVAIAGVISMKPKILILDEPTAGLDPAGRKEILGLVSDLCREQKMTIILVSHSMDDVAEYADRILVINDGKLAIDATPREVFNHKEELESFGLSLPQVTKAMVRLKESGIPVNTDAITVDEALNEILRVLK
ncbi:energy-coupling factor transport system ATP-binding protein [Lachnospiraceae bacterium G41]|jgi:energy-coupling factor transport system ATP-binding protein|nr:energy-coupling factor transport system ATP-binding protein [Lachnospiraceae bacterium G41]